MHDKLLQYQDTEARHESQEALTIVIYITEAVKLPAWDYQKRLTDLLAAHPAYENHAPNWPHLVKLRDVGYSPKTKAEAQPLRIQMVSGLCQLPQNVGEAGKSQRSSTGVDSLHVEPLQPSSSSTQLGVEGTRFCQSTSKAQSRERRR